MAPTKTIKVDVISDFLCPWCYVGLIDLERGIAAARAVNPAVDFVVQYHPFILNPSLSCDEPKDKLEFFKAKLGAEKFEQMKVLVEARGKQDGIRFTFDGVLRQTTRAHRLMTRAYLVGGQTTQLALLKRLFRAYFEDGEDIGDPATLARHAVAVGMFPPSRAEIASSADADADDDDADESEVREKVARAWVEGHELEEEVKRMSADAARKGVTGVPFAVIDGKWAVSGCQKTECYIKIFEKLATAETVPLTPRVEPQAVAAA